MLLNHLYPGSPYSFSYAVFCYIRFLHHYHKTNLINQSFENIRKTRTYLLDFISELATEQLNEIPAGFNNNIAWNLAHLVAAQQGLCYINSGWEMQVPKSVYEQYRPGTKPEHFINTAELDTIRQWMPAHIGQMEADYAKGLFKQYEPRPTRYGVTLNSIGDVIRFLPYHEGLHLGYIMALKRLVKR
jgi:uncharacterized damage-inducible protein DinB